MTVNSTSVSADASCYYVFTLGLGMASLANGGLHGRNDKTSFHADEAFPILD